VINDLDIHFTADLTCAQALCIHLGVLANSSNQTAGSSAVSNSVSESTDTSSNTSEFANQTVSESETETAAADSQETYAAVSENTPDPIASESESSDLYAMDTVMSLTAYGSHA